MALKRKWVLAGWCGAGAGPCAHGAAVPVRVWRYTGQPLGIRQTVAGIMFPMSTAKRLTVRCLLLAPLVGVMLPWGCATMPPSNIRDGCAILKEKEGWYQAVQASYEKWGVPPQVQLAIIYQESRFRYDAKAPRDTLLWVIPWGRKSSAYGYAQVKNETWRWYQDKTGNRGADRDDCADAVDFIGWYGNLSHQMLGISKWDAYGQYLAYHEGHGGYQRGTYRQKPGLMGVARKVEARSKTYAAQLASCKSELNSGSRLWPF